MKLSSKFFSALSFSLLLSTSVFNTYANEVMMIEEKSLETPKNLPLEFSDLFLQKSYDMHSSIDSLMEGLSEKYPESEVREFYSKVSLTNSFFNPEFFDYLTINFPSISCIIVDSLFDVNKTQFRNLDLAKLVSKVSLWKNLNRIELSNLNAPYAKEKLINDLKRGDVLQNVEFLKITNSVIDIKVLEILVKSNKLTTLHLENVFITNDNNNQLAVVLVDLIKKNQLKSLTLVNLLKNKNYVMKKFCEALTSKNLSELSYLNIQKNNISSDQLWMIENQIKLKNFHPDFVFDY